MGTIAHNLHKEVNIIEKAHITKEDNVMENKKNNKKTNVKRNKNNYTVPIITLTIVGSMLWVWFKFSSTGLEKVIVLYIFAVMVIPLSIKLFLSIFPTMFKEIPAEQREANNIIARDNYKQAVQKMKRDANKKKPKKVNDSPLYIPCRDTIIACMQNRLFTREDILELKCELDYRLGTHRFVYDNFNFENNDLKEIYTKLKSKKLTTEDYQYLLDVINQTVARNVKEESV